MSLHHQRRPIHIDGCRVVVALSRGDVVGGGVVNSCKFLAQSFRDYSQLPNLICISATGMSMLNKTLTY